MDSFSDSPSSWNTYDSLKNFSQISAVIQTRVKHVYVTACCYLIALAVGAYLHILWNMGVILPTLAILGCMFCLITTPPCEEPKRVFMLMAFFISQGAFLVPIINSDPRILVTEFLGGAIIFGCFSGAATLTRRREFLYLIGLVYSGVLILFWLHFASNIFGGDVALFQFELYCSLMLLAGCMVFQTQVLITEIWIKEFGWEGEEEEEEQGDYGEKLHSTTNKKAM